MGESEASVAAAKLRAKQVEVLYGQMAVLLLANVAAAALVAAFLQPRAGPAALVWLAAVMSIALGGAVLSRRYRRRDRQGPEAAVWARLFTAGSAASGIAWGVGCYALFVPGDPRSQLLIAFAAGGMAAGGVAALNVWLPAYFGFVTPLLGGMFFVLVAQGDSNYLVMAGMVALMYGAFAVVAANVNRTLSRSLAAAEAAQAADHAKSQFFAAMSHELRTPLNAILGFSEMLKNEVFGPLGSRKYGDYAADIHRSAGELLTLVNDTLELSSIDLGGMELKEDRIDLAAAVKTARTMVQEAANAGGVRIAVDLSHACPMLCADERLIKRVLLVLLSGAIKFTPRDGEVTLETRLEDGGGFLLRVTDGGEGFAPAELPRAMADFSGADATHAVGSDAAGFGYALAKALVELQGGSFDLQSALGVGTTAAVRFPPGYVVE